MRALDGPQGPAVTDATKDPYGGHIVFPQGPSAQGHVVVPEGPSVRPDLEESHGPAVKEYYTVKRPKVPVLVNLYKKVGEKLMNVDKSDDRAYEEDLSAGAAVKLRPLRVRIEDLVCMCIAIPREFVHQLHCVITMEGAPRVFVAWLRPSRRYNDLLVLSKADVGTLTLERTRREKWMSRALYHVPGRGVWVLVPSGLMQRC